MLGEFLLVAQGAVDVLPLGQEALGVDGLLALVAGEAVFMPHVVLVLHVLGAWGGNAR